MFGNIPEYFPLRAWWRQGNAELAAPTSSFAGKTVLMTGASGAICSAAAAMLIDLGADTIVFGVPDIAESGPENSERLTALLGAERLRKARVLVWHLDMLWFDGVAAFAARAANELERLDVVVMGAAIINHERKISLDGWEQMLQIIHLSCALLAVLLLPTLIRSAEQHQTRGVMTIVTTMAARMAGAVYPTPKGDQGLLGTISNGMRTRLEVGNQYGVTKLTHLAWLRELCCRVKDTHVTVHAVDFCVASEHRGITTTSASAGLVARVFGRPIETCARAVVNSCVAHTGTHGAVFMDYDVCPYPKFLDDDWGREMQKRVWEETEKVLSSASPAAKDAFSGLKPVVTPVLTKTR